MFSRLLAFFILAVFAASVQATPEESAFVRIGYYESETFQEGSEGKALRGYAYEYYQLLAQYAGLRYEYVFGTYQELYQKLLDGNIDLMAGIARTPDRDSLMSFSMTPMGQNVYHLFKKAQNVSITEDPSTLQGKKIGTVKGSMSQALFQYLGSNHVNSSIVAFRTPEERDNALDSGIVDAVIVDKFASKPRLGVIPFARLNNCDYYLAISKSRPDLLEKVNQALGQITADDPIYQAKLFDKYIRPYSTSRFLSASEKSWVAAHDTLKIGFLRNMLPYSHSKKNSDDPDGIVKDLFPEILSKLHLDSMTLHYKGYDTYDQMVEALTNGETDVAFPIGGNMYHAEMQGIFESKPVIRTNLNLIYRGELNDSIYTNFAVNKNTKMMEFYIQDNFPKASIKEYESIEAALNALLYGDAKATVLGNLRSIHILQNREYEHLNVKFLNVPNDKFLGVAAGNENLLHLLNRGLTLISDNYAINLSYKYAEKLHKPVFLDLLANHPQQIILFFLILIFAIIAFFSFLYKRITERTLREKTQNELLSTRLDVIRTISDQYHSAFLFNVNKNSFLILHTFRKMEESIAQMQDDAQEALNYVTEHLILDKYRATFRKFNNIGFWKIALLNKNSISEEYEGIFQGWCRATVLVARRDKNGNPTLVIYLSTEIGEQKRTELHLQEALEQAEEANKAKTLFLNNMSHDIRTPMNAIIGFTTLAQIHIDEKDRVKDYLGKINTSSNHLLSLINDVLDMRRIESGKVNLEETPTNLSSLLNDIKSIVQPNILLMEQNLSIETQDIVHEDFITDKLRLNQILLNLLSNAIKFTRKEGNISLLVKEIPCTTPDHAKYEFHVTDNGIGMSREFQKHIYEAFAREETSTVSGIQGTGLGMSITRNIVNMMGGSIAIKSEEDKGSEFTVTLEFKLGNKKELEKTFNQRQEASVQKFKGLRLLLVEDNQLNQEIASTLISETGFIVDVVVNGQEAVEKIITSPAGTYKLILMDIQMPIMDGYEATRRIRHIPNLEKSEIPIIAMTANAFEEDRNLALECGMNGYLSKPINMAKVIEVITKVLKESQTQGGITK